MQIVQAAGTPKQGAQGAAGNAGGQIQELPGSGRLLGVGAQRAQLHRPQRGERRRSRFGAQARMGTEWPGLGHQLGVQKFR